MPSRAVFTTTLLALAGVGCSAWRAGDEVDGQASADAVASSPSAATRVRTIRERFAHHDHRPEVRTPVLDRGVVARFRADRDGTGDVRPVVPAAALRGVARPAIVALPRAADGWVALEDATSGLAIRFALQSAAPAAVEAADGIALYRRAVQGADVVHRVRPEGTEDFVVFESRPEVEELRYDLDVRRVAGLRLVGGALEMLDRGGAPRLRVEPPYVVDARGERHDAALAVEGCEVDARPAAPWGRPVTSPGADDCTVVVRWSGVAYPAIVDPCWVTTGSMMVARTDHTATVLDSGQVLIAGGTTPSGDPCEELYDPGTGTFALTGCMPFSATHAAARLASGAVLVLGAYAAGAAGNVARLYLPDEGFFATTGAMVHARGLTTATTLPSGEVLVVGGMGSSSRTGGMELSSAELYDPASGGFREIGSLSTARSGHTATMLPDGDVLVAGGEAVGEPLDVAERYDADREAFVPAPRMNARRVGHSATRLSSGLVLLAGGDGGSASAELYDPVADAFSVTGSMLEGRRDHVAALLPSGAIMVAGGRRNGAILATVEIYAPTTATFVSERWMNQARADHTASALPSGDVLVAGGGHGSAMLASAEIFDVLGPPEPGDGAGACGGGDASSPVGGVTVGAGGDAPDGGEGGQAGGRQEGGPDGTWSGGGEEDTADVDGGGGCAVAGRSRHAGGASGGALVLLAARVARARRRRGRPCPRGRG